MIRFIFCLFTALAVFFQALPASAAEAAISDKIQQFYEKLNGFSASFTQELFHKESNSKEERQGSLSFQKPLLINWTVKKPQEEILIATPKEIWNYLPDEEIIYRYAPQALTDSKNVIQVITGQAKITKDFDVKEKGMENGLQKLTIFPKEPTPQMVEADLWVDPASGRIQKARSVDFYGNANLIILDNFKANPKFKSGEFNFTPPKGVEIEDRIGSQVEERNLFQ